jgi:hypothetical protein
LIGVAYGAGAGFGFGAALAFFAIIAALAF